MLLRFKIKNFLSFYQETCFDMFPNPKREQLSHHINTAYAIPFLKQAAIYGANGSGKSNFIKAIRFLRDFVINENFLKDINFEEFVFQLTDKKTGKIEFEIEFISNNKYYLYEVALTKEEVYEKLHFSGIGQTGDKLIFERIGSKIEAQQLENETSVKKLLSLNPLASILPLNAKFPLLPTEITTDVLEWFGNKIEIIDINSRIPALIGLLAGQPPLLAFVNSVFSTIGIGISSVEIESVPFKEWAVKSKNSEEIKRILDVSQGEENQEIAQWQDNRNTLNIAIEKGITTIQELLFNQIGLNGYAGKMKIGAQSEGTVRLLTLIPAFYSAMFEGKAVFIDEIDNSVHPNLIANLLKFYANNTANGQLIFTTHSTHLLNQQELLRPDEVWLTEKEEGNTQMYSLNDFKLQNHLNIENGYLEGRYGGIPKIKPFEML